MLSPKVKAPVVSPAGDRSIAAGPAGSGRSLPSVPVLQRQGGRPQVIQLSPEENIEYRGFWFAALKKKYPEGPYIAGRMKLLEVGTHEKGEIALYQQEIEKFYADIMEGTKGQAEAISVELEDGEYKKQLNELEQRSDHLLEIPTHPRQYETARADGSSLLKSSHSGEGIQHFTGQLKIRFSTAGIGDEKELRKVVLSNLLSGNLKKGQELHVRTVVAVKEGKGLFDPDTPVYADVIIYSSPDDAYDVRVLKARANEGSSLKEDAHDPVKIQALKTELIETYHLKEFGEEGGAHWSEHDLVKLKLALTRIPEKDREALQGLEFIRAKEISLDETGRVLGSFSSGDRPGIRQIRLGDGTFDADAISFIGSGLQKGATYLSVQTIIHEVGHAVVNQKRLDCRDKLIGLQDKLGALRKEQVQAAALAPAPGELFSENALESEIGRITLKGIEYQLEKSTALRKLVSSAFGEANLKSLGGDDKDKKFIAAIAEMINAFNELISEATPGAKDAWKAKKAAAKAAANELDDIGPFRKIIEEAAAYQGAEGTGLIKKLLELKEEQQSEEYKAKQAQLAEKRKKEEEERLKYEAIIKKLDSQVDLLRAEINKMGKVYEEHSYPEKEGYSSSIKRFVDFVKRTKMPPQITDYAGKSWNLDNPEEFFAEAYSIWINDPVFLRKNYLPLYGWFQEGNYRD